MQCGFDKSKTADASASAVLLGGDKRDRTADLLNAINASSARRWLRHRRRAFSLYLQVIPKAM